MRILIIDQCSGKKQVPDWFEPYTQSELSEHTYEELVDSERVPTVRARELYEGRQQQYISDATAALRAAGDTVDRVFISAGFGVVDEDTLLPPYDITFNDLSNNEIQTRSTKLGIQEDILDIINTTPPYDLIFFVLGSDYYASLDLEAVLAALPVEASAVLFNQERIADAHDQVVSIPARTTEAEEHGTITVALKGWYLQNFATHRDHGVAIHSLQDIVIYCTTEYTTQTGLTDYDPD